MLENGMVLFHCCTQCIIPYWGVQTELQSGFPGIIIKKEEVLPDAIVLFECETVGYILKASLCCQ